MRLPTLLLALLTFVGTASAREFRELTDQSGRKVQAEILDVIDGKVKVNINLKPFEIPMENLSPEDQEWLTQWDLVRKQGAEAAYYREVIFTDDFSKDGFGERWGHYKSGSVVKDGVLVGITPDGSDHSAVDSIKFEGRKDMEVSVKFQFISDQAKSFNVWFDDFNYKGSHAGHIVSVSVSPSNVTIADAKTGGFENEIYAKRNAPGGMTPELQKFLDSKTVRLPVTVDLKDWHTLLIRTKADEAVVMIDGKTVGSFSSEGILHDTKSLVSLTTNAVDVHYDDFSIKAASPAK
jgi:hypothetical protein